MCYYQAFSTVPRVQITVQHGTKQQKKDAMSVWMENITTSQFEVCLRESRALDGGHSKISVVSRDDAIFQPKKYVLLSTYVLLSIRLYIRFHNMIIK